MRRRIAIIVVAVVALLAIGAGVLFAISRTPANLGGTQWTLTRLVTSEQEQPLPATRHPTIRFLVDQRQVAGFSGCNSYSADYILLGNTLHFNSLRTTLMACVGPGLAPDERVMALEAAYQQALMQVSQYALLGDTLTLSGGGSIELTYQRG
ncbi:MAG TPA: META domain-containing protein [Ktedonobacterales bacterium]